MHLSHMKHAALAVVVLAALLFAGAGRAAAVTPSDTFEGTAVDTSRWHVSTTPDASAAVADGKLILTAGPNASEVGPSVNLFSTWRLRGAFDVQVDFTLLAWPDHPYASVGLLALPPNDYCGVERTSIDLTGTGSADQCYLTNFYPSAGGQLSASLTSDQSGKLRLVRDGGTITGYRWDEGTSAWVVISSTAAEPDDVTIRLSCWGDAGMAIRAAFDNFVVSEGEVVEPTIDDLDLVRRTETDEQGRVHHSLTLGAEISDPEGLSDIASITIDDSDGNAWTALAGARPYPVRWCREDDNTAFVCWEIPLDAAPPAGALTVTLTDAAANTDVVVTPGNSAMPAPLSLTHPEPDDFTPYMMPSFVWTALPAGWTATLDLIEEGTGSIWTTGVTDLTTVDYNADGQALRPALQLGCTYSWTVTASTGDDSARMRARTELVGRARFAKVGGMPSLAQLLGKLAYTTVSVPDWNTTFIAVMQYQTGGSPIVTLPPAWLTANGMEHADWSPDGSTLLLGDGGHTYLDHLDGLGPVEIPGVYGADQRWSADGTQIVYAIVGQPAAFVDQDLDIWVAGADGSDPHSVAAHDGADRYPAWSPDGQWISYRRELDPEGQFLWMVRPDGTDDHAVLGDEVKGYPGYLVRALGVASWSPDATRLAVEFGADPPSGSGGRSIQGIAVIAREGGPVKPVFVAPEGIVCCAAPKLPLWSPDGRQIVFVSGHHLPVNPAWADGAFEPEDELWLANADGSSGPDRLTYNHSLETDPTWWAEPRFTDVPHGYWAYNAISTCNLAGIVRGYWDGYHPEREVDRASMAVYIARGLAGSDASVHVPAGVTEPTFPDVGADHWAYKYVEYAVAANVVEGYPGGNYRPAEIVNRGQMAVYIARAMLSPTGDAALPDPPAEPTFSDVTAASEWVWCHPHVEYLAAAEIVQGYWDERYRPELAVTRDQMAVYVARAFALPM